jgi:hypothetical protein
MPPGRVQGIDIQTREQEIKEMPGPLGDQLASKDNNDEKEKAAVAVHGPDSGSVPLAYIAR